MIGPVHEELLAGIGDYPVVRLNDGNLRAVREARRAAVLPIGPLDGVTWEERHIAGPDGAPDVRLLIYRPEADGRGRPGILHFHGGGLVVGVPEMVHDRNGWLVRELGCVIVSVDYRKAPEDPFPAGVEDGWAALGWMRGAAEELGVDPACIALLGESAGGCMAATMAGLAHDRAGGPPLIAQVLVYPMLDDRSGIEEVPEDREHPIWTETSNRYAWAAYLGVPAGSDTVPEGAVPARRADLGGLPPAWIGVGSIDLFADDNLQYARRLLAADVECEVLVIPGACHAFQRIAPGSRISQTFENSYKDALRRFFAKAQAG